VHGIFIHLPVIKFQNTFLVKFQKSYLIFQTGFEIQITLLKIYKKGILKIPNQEVSKNPKHRI